MKHLHRLFRRFAACPLCRQTHKSPPTHSLCPICQKIVTRLQHTTQTACLCCGLPLLNAEETPNICGRCLKKPPLRHLTLAAFEYQFPVSHMLTRFKFNADFHCLPPLAKALQQRIYTHYANIPYPDVLITTPLHTRRLCSRGFNQAALIANLITPLHLQNTQHQPIIRRDHCLVRIQNTQPQTQLDAQHRHRNMAQAFQCPTHTRSEIAHKTVAVLDDVITTGETIEAISQCLLESGARAVHAWCIARA